MEKKTETTIVCWDIRGDSIRKGFRVSGLGLTV